MSSSKRSFFTPGSSALLSIGRRRSAPLTSPRYESNFFTFRLELFFFYLRFSRFESTFYVYRRPRFTMRLFQSFGRSLKWGTTFKIEQFTLTQTRILRTNGKQTRQANFNFLSCPQAGTGVFIQLIILNINIRLGTL